MFSKMRTTVALATLFLTGFVLSAGAAFAVDPSPLAQPDYAGQLGSAATSGGGVFSQNVLYAFLIPVLWVGYKVARRVLAKIG